MDSPRDTLGETFGRYRTSVFATVVVTDPHPGGYYPLASSLLLPTLRSAPVREVPASDKDVVIWMQPGILLIDWTANTWRGWCLLCKFVTGFQLGLEFC